MAKLTDDASKWSTRWPAPGKLNLLLKIVGRRADGYHQLQTVFQFIDHCDWLSFKYRPDGRVRLMTPLPGVVESQELTVRAAHLLKKESGCKQGIDIEIEKNLPMGGGLGGGSSDAATTLLVLNELWDLGISTDRLVKLSVQLGADVPVFVKGCSAWAEGVGEDLTPMELPEPWYVIIVPDCSVSTQEVFASPLLTRDSKPIRMEKFISGHQENDCLAVVSEIYPQVNDAMSDLSQYGNSRLTGTGACVFASFDSLARARDAMRALSGRWEVFISKGRNLSPLHETLNSA